MKTFILLWSGSACGIGRCKDTVGVGGVGVGRGSGPPSPPEKSNNQRVRL